MRLRLGVLSIALTVLLAATTAPVVSQQSYPHCPTGEPPRFVLGVNTLKTLLGDRMGQPLECEHANPENGDTLQQTTTGLAFWRKATNTATFTNGWDHWAITAQGLVYWTGSSIDPPPEATALAVLQGPEVSGAEAARLLELVNQARAAESLVALAHNAALDRGAQTYAETLAATGCFSHTCPPVPNLADRIEQAGYLGWRIVGENIAWNSRTVEQSFQGWMNSPGHRANILRTEFREMGLGLAYNERGEPYWVQLFGARR